MAKENKHTILKREGSNQHILYGKFKVDEPKDEFPTLVVESNSVLKHEQADGSFGEHNSLSVEKGSWRVGKQVEYNPFKREISQIWD